MIGAHTSILGFLGSRVVRGMGVGFAFMPAMTAAFAALERSGASDAAPQLNVLQRVGGSIGTAVLAVVLERALARRAHASTQAAEAYGTAFWWSVGITAAAIVPASSSYAPSARRARAADARPDADLGAAGGERRVTTAAQHRPLATRRSPELGASFKRAMAAVRRLRGRDTHRPGRPASPSTSCSSRWTTAMSSRPASSPPPPIFPRPRSARCSTRWWSSVSSLATARRTTGAWSRARSPRRAGS